MSLKLRMSRTHHYIQQPSGCVTTEDTTESCKRGRCFITNECPPTGPSLFGGPCFHIIHTRNPCQADKNISGCCSSLCAARAHVPPSLLWWLRADLWGSPPFRPCLFRLGLKVCAMLVCVYAGGGGLYVWLGFSLAAIYIFIHCSSDPLLPKLTHRWAQRWFSITVLSLMRPYSGAQVFMEGVCGGCVFILDLRTESVNRSYSKKIPILNLYRFFFSVM